MPLPFRGIIKHWNAARGFGFIERDDRQPDLFVHYKDVRPRVEALIPGQAVAFDVIPDSRPGKIRAAPVVLL